MRAVARITLSQIVFGAALSVVVLDVFASDEIVSIDDLIPLEAVQDMGPAASADTHSSGPRRTTTFSSDGAEPFREHDIVPREAIELLRQELGDLTKFGYVRKKNGAVRDLRELRKLRERYRTVDSILDDIAFTPVNLEALVNQGYVVVGGVTMGVETHAGGQVWNEC